MLVLTRRPGESLLIGNQVVVTLLDAGRGRIRLGIEAPPEVRIVRQELCPAGPPRAKMDNVPGTEAPAAAQ